MRKSKSAVVNLANEYVAAEKLHSAQGVEEIRVIWADLCVMKQTGDEIPGDYVEST